MKKIYFLLIVFSVALGVHAQQINLGNTGNNFGWFRLGTLTLPQQGADVSIQITSGGGYNASLNQNGECHIHFRTSNAVSEANGFFAAGSFYNTGRTKILAAIRVIQIDESTWEFYAIMPSFTGQAAVLSLSTIAGTWQPSLAKLDPPSNLAALDLTEELLVSSNSFYMGNVGIGTITPREKLSVNGNIRAKEIKVEATNWPDYVFEEGYKVGTLEALESYIKINKHLPDMPGAKEIEDKGIALGEIVKMQQKKIEELTLFLIEHEHRMKEQAKILVRQKKEISKLKKRIK
ncbi:hypothetical protein [Pedobacter sp. SG908]|uniref:hypothetical protein n=1 Tax=Pedobacter sp. SG908 TaxID=2587135 RepID=UPI001422666E|nr:hypothetical protein [Pedobacter sp. SG908]NII83296.1 hypothetical protein [Pedobacter sp. SG908]